MNIRDLIKNRKAGESKGDLAIGQLKERWKGHSPAYVPGEELERIVDRPTRLKDVTKAWRLAHSCAYPGRMVPEFNRKQGGQLRRFVDIMPGENKLRTAVFAVVTVLSDWPTFADRAKKLAGARFKPGMPDVGFLLRYAHVAADMAVGLTPRPGRVEGQEEKVQISRPRPKDEMDAKEVRKILLED